MIPQPCEIWLAQIQFTNGLASKVRPVLILWLDAKDAIVAAVTSAPPRSTTDLALQDWAAEGLRVASTVRLSRLDCLEQSSLIRRLGRISPGDADSVKGAWNREIRLTF
jgi:mRNA interferase MazF